MPNVYSYRARDFTGKIISGQIQADDINRAAEMIREKRLIIVTWPRDRSRRRVPPFSKEGDCP